MYHVTHIYNTKNAGCTKLNHQTHYNRQGQSCPVLSRWRRDWAYTQVFATDSKHVTWIPYHICASQIKQEIHATKDSTSISDGACDHPCAVQQGWAAKQRARGITWTRPALYSICHCLIMSSPTSSVSTFASWRDVAVSSCKNNWLQSQSLLQYCAACNAWADDDDKLPWCL